MERRPIILVDGFWQELRDGDTLHDVMHISVYDPGGEGPDRFLNRDNHFGTQTLATISDAGEAAALNVGTDAGTVAAGDHTHPPIPVMAGSAANGTPGLVPYQPAGSEDFYLSGDGVWKEINIPIMIGDNELNSNDGVAGLVPAPLDGDFKKVLTGAGTWEKIEQPSVVVSYFLSYI